MRFKFITLSIISLSTDASAGIIIITSGIAFVAFISTSLSIFSEGWNVKKSLGWLITACIGMFAGFIELGFFPLAFPRVYQAIVIGFGLISYAFVITQWAYSHIPQQGGEAEPNQTPHGRVVDIGTTQKTEVLQARASRS